MKNLTKLPARNLDVLRMVAVLSVVVDHFLMVTVGDWHSLPYTLGLFGVYCFFVHTSLVLMSSLERQGFGVALSWPAAVRFYIRRAFRVLPLVWAVVFVVILLRVPPFPGKPFVVPATRELVANLGVFQNLVAVRDIQGPLWSLPLEMQMYLLLPFLFLLARRSLRGLVGLFAITTVASSLYWYFGGSGMPLIWRLTILQYAPCFLSGVLAYAILCRYNSILDAKLLPVAIALALGLFFLAQWPGHDGRGWIACLFLGLAISIVREIPRGAVATTGKTIATYSYGIYLIHVPALWLGFTVLHTQPGWARSLVFVIATTVGSYLAYHMVEQPGIRVGQWIINQPMSRAATAPAP